MHPAGIGSLLWSRCRLLLTCPISEERGIPLITGAKSFGTACGQMCQKFRAALRQSAADLVTAGYPKAAVIKERVLRTGGIASQGS